MMLVLSSSTNRVTVVLGVGNGNLTHSGTLTGLSPGRDKRKRKVHCCLLAACLPFMDCFSSAVPLCHVTPPANDELEPLQTVG